MAATLYIFSAPSGCGKTSLIESLLKITPQLKTSVSYTTRAPRSREIEGVHYQFVSLKDFQKMIREDAFLEYATVFDHYYGTLRARLNQMLQEGIDVILEIDWQGMQQIKKSYPEAVSIFILPPSLLSLRERLLQRSEDQLAVVESRLKKARAEIEQAVEYDYIVVNDQFQKAVNDLQAIIQTQRLRRISQASIITSLLNE